eukprot:GHVS01105770.1.p1 GENE.GHVS01105770.1~~GHVS01105770.1.p1  ORF type:complete len:178 (+),score=18.62 GHVS01105770.1:134-667(+)
MESYTAYPGTATDQQNGYAVTTNAQPEPQTQVGPEWGQQFVDNFFQTQPATQGAQPMYTSGEYVNTPSNVNYGGASPVPMSSSQQAYYTSAAPAMAQGIYQQPPPNAGYGGYGNQVSYSAGYYEPNRSMQPAGYGVPQFQAPQYASYAPQGGSQVYMMPPVVKKSSSSKKKKQGMCC